ncbi:MAG: hypothetical protein U0K68_03870 [Agathobacter sp.]|nr:hypothetical protein [Agathobacter sp.]
MKKIARLIGAILFLVAMIVPVIALIWISNIEQKDYQITDDLRIGDVAYGEICEVQRLDIEETVELSGDVVSNKVEFIELNKFTDIYKMRMIVSEGDFISKGQLIAYYKGEEIYAEKSGIVKAINMGEDNYIMLESLSDLVIRVDCSDDITFKKLSQKKLKLSDDEGVQYKVIRIDNAVNAENQRYAYVKPDNSETLTYGDKVDKIKLYTGKTYTDALAINKNCVYSCNDNKLYVRVISDSGVEEVEVQVGFYSGDYAVISGVDEGTKCDSGFKSLMENEDREDE